MTLNAVQSDDVRTRIAVGSPVPVLEKLAIRRSKFADFARIVCERRINLRTHSVIPSSTRE